MLPYSRDEAQNKMLALKDRWNFIFMSMIDILNVAPLFQGWGTE